MHGLTTQKGQREAGSFELLVCRNLRLFMLQQAQVTNFPPQLNWRLFN